MTLPRIRSFWDLPNKFEILKDLSSYSLNSISNVHHLTVEPNDDKKSFKNNYLVPDVNGGVDGVVVGRHGLFQSGVAKVVGGPGVNIKKYFSPEK